MSIHYSHKTHRFFSDKNGRFVSRKRGLSSSIARGEYKSVSTKRKKKKKEKIKFVEEKQQTESIEEFSLDYEEGFIDGFTDSHDIYKEWIPPDTAYLAKPLNLYIESVDYTDYFSLIEDEIGDDEEQYFGG